MFRNVFIMKCNKIVYILCLERELNKLLPTRFDVES